MTIDELVTRAEAVIMEDYEPDEWVGFIKSVLAELNPIAKVRKTYSETLTPTDGSVEIDLSDIEDFYEPVAVYYTKSGSRIKYFMRQIGVQDGISTGWSRDGDTILIQNIGNSSVAAKLDYYVKLAVDDDTFNLPEKYHDVVLKGVMVIAMQREEELDRKNDFSNEYSMAKRQMMAERVQEMEPWYAQAVAAARMGGGQ